MTQGDLLLEVEQLDDGKDGLPGITVADVLQVFEQRRLCEHCSNSKELEGAPTWRRHGKIVERRWPDGRRDWCCSYCGRTANEKA